MHNADFILTLTFHANKVQIIVQISSLLRVSTDKTEISIYKYGQHLNLIREKYIFGLFSSLVACQLRCQLKSLFTINMFLSQIPVFRKNLPIIVHSLAFKMVFQK